MPLPARVGPGPAWCWLTPAGMAATGHPWPARPPALARLAHIRAVLAARLWLQAAPAYAEAGAWWRSERRIRAALPAHVGAAHVADAEIHWPSSAARPARRPGLGHRSGADAEAGRADRADHGRAAGPARLRAGGLPVLSPAARAVVTATAGNLPESQRGRVAVRDLPPSALHARAAR